ncbi:MAG TPA: CBS domain-containing protein, partial [Methanomassiliicoccales archaeon]|nr:CBS domain-containing protein [Methanomassiliicoccales archaeon]
TIEAVKRREVIRSQIDAFKITDLIDKKYECVDPEMAVSEAIAKMRALDVHEMPVTEDCKKLIGVLSFGRIIRRKNLVTGMKVRSVMDLPPPITVDTEVTRVAEEFISTGYRHMTVMRNKNIVGVISRNSIASLVPQVKDLRNMKVQDIMSTDVRAVKESDSVKEALELMRSLDVRTLPVVDKDGQLTGIIGIKDIVNYSWFATPRRETVGEKVGNKDPVEVKVGSLEIEAVKTIEPNKLLSDAVDLMARNDISTVPVLEKDKLVGVITTYDVIQLLASYGKRDFVYTQITGLEAEDRYSLDVMEKEIQSELAKVAKVTKPMLFTMHVTKYHPTGNTAKYSLNARLFTANGTFFGSAVNWNLGQATVDLMNVLQGRVMEMKEERIDKKKRSRREPA